MFFTDSTSGNISYEFYQVVRNGTVPTRIVVHTVLCVHVGHTDQSSGYRTIRVSFAGKTNVSNPKWLSDSTDHLFFQNVTQVNGTREQLLCIVRLL